MNIPSYDKKRFSFGPGVLYMGAPGSTPLTDIGAVKGGIEMTLERKVIEVKQGSPKSTVAQYVTEENLSFKITGLEWNLDNLSYAMGAGVTSISEPNEVLEFGGEMTINERAFRYVHVMPEGGTIDVHIFKAQSNGKVTVNFNDADMHEFPYEFKALVATTDFANQALATNKKLFKIIRTKA